MKQNSAIVISHSRSRGRIPVLIGRTAGMGRPTQWTAVVSAHSHMFLFAPRNLYTRRLDREPMDHLAPHDVMVVFLALANSSSQRKTCRGTGQEIRPTLHVR